MGLSIIIAFTLEYKEAQTDPSPKITCEPQYSYTWCIVQSEYPVIYPIYLQF